MAVNGLRSVDYQLCCNTTLIYYEWWNVITIMLNVIIVMLKRLKTVGHLDFLYFSRIMSSSLVVNFEQQTAGLQSRTGPQLKTIIWRPGMATPGRRSSEPSGFTSSELLRTSKRTMHACSTTLYIIAYPTENTQIHFLCHVHPAYFNSVCITHYVDCALACCALNYIQCVRKNILYIFDCS